MTCVNTNVSLCLNRFLLPIISDRSFHFASILRKSLGSWKTSRCSQSGKSIGRPPSRLGWRNCVRRSPSCAPKWRSYDARTSNSGSRPAIGAAQHAAAKQRIAELEQEVAQLRGENRKLQDQLFGRKSESAAATDRSNHLDDPDDTPEPQPRGQRRGRPGPKRRDYSHLPVREDPRELPESERVCPICGLPLTACGAEESEQIEIETVIYRRIIRRRRYQRTCSCPGPRTVTAPVVPKLIPKGRLGVSMWVEILLDKYASQRPTERLLRSWRLLGLDLSAGTVADGLHRLEPLFRGLYEALIARSRVSAFHQADETRWLVFVAKEGKIGHGWWLWVVGSAEVAVYILDPSRSHEVPETHFPHERPRCSSGRPLLRLQSNGSGEEAAGSCWPFVGLMCVATSCGWARVGLS